MTRFSYYLIRNSVAAVIVLAALPIVVIDEAIVKPIRRVIRRN